MARPRKGSMIRRAGKLYARITWIDQGTGKQRSKERQIRSEAELAKAVRQLEADLDLGGPELFEGDKMKFAQLARIFAEEHYKPPTYVNGRKVDGMRSWKNSKGFLKPLVEHFGGALIRNMNHAAIDRYKRLRLSTPTIRGTERSITAVNRELEELRKIMRYAIYRGWLIRDPFIGKTLINKADEPERIRVYSVDEELAILAQCNHPRRLHLRSIIILGIDTFVRPSELFRLKKADVDFEQRVLTVLAENSKTFVRRTIGLTPRALDEFRRLTEFIGPDDLIFQVDSVKRSWATACRLAGVTNARIQDLRDTGITRRLEAVVRAGLPWQIVMKEAGHTQIKTFMRYFGPRIELLQAAADAMALLHSRDVTEDDNAENISHLLLMPAPDLLT